MFSSNKEHQDRSGGPQLYSDNEQALKFTESSKTPKHIVEKNQDSEEYKLNTLTSFQKHNYRLKCGISHL